MKKITFAFLLVLAITAVSFGIADAHDEYADLFNAYYGTDGVKNGTTLGSCITCHNQIDGKGKYNPYGQDWKDAGKSFEAIELLDSDGDGFDNITEIINDTFPGDPNSPPTGPVNNPPTADAGADQTVALGDTVTLNGSGSQDVDGDPLSFSWSWVSRPSGSSASLSDAAAVRPTFNVDLHGTYVARLIVNDTFVDSAPDTVTISTLNSAPTADAGPDQSVHVGDAVTLDGTGSSDTDGDALSFSWSWVSRPSGSSAALSDPAAVKPTFNVDLPGTYVARLIVNDAFVDSDPDTVTVSTLNTAPTADAGPDQSVHVGDAVTLDGSGSSDTDGNALSFSWSWVSRPSGSSAALSDPAAVSPIFNVDLAGTYVVQLMVNDSTQDSEPDSVTITTENSAPVAEAGPDQAAHAGETISLDGSQSQDADSDPLTFVWSFVSVPEGSTSALSDPTVVSPTFVADVSGTYVVQLIVNDGKLDSPADTVSISTGNSAPVADAGKRRNTLVGDTVTLDGSKSTDPDGDSLTFKWSLSSRPADSSATLSGASSSIPSFMADVPGIYLLQLIVNDGTLDSDPSTCIVKARKQNGKAGVNGNGNGKGSGSTN